MNTFQFLWVCSGILLLFGLGIITLWCRVNLFERRVYRVLRNEHRLNIRNDALINELWWSGYSVPGAAVEVKDRCLNKANHR